MNKEKLLIITITLGVLTMAKLTIEKRLARLEAVVFGNRTDTIDNTAKIEYIAACDYPEVFDEDEGEMTDEDDL